MNKNIFKIIVISGVILSHVITFSAQQVNTQYFLENVPTRHYLNPAFQPVSDIYISLPVIGFTQFGVTNNSLSLRDVVYNKNGETILFLNPYGDKDKFYKKLRGNTIFRADAQTNILGFGFRTADAYWNFSLIAKTDGQASMPKDLFKLALYGTPDMYNNSYDLKRLGADATAYLEAGLGYSRDIDEQWRVGAKVKFFVRRSQCLH